MEWLHKNTHNLSDTAQLRVADALRNTAIVWGDADACAWQNYGIDANTLVVADTHTHKFLPTWARALPCHLLGSNPHATHAEVEALIRAAKSSSATMLLAVGSGTINDLCKYSSAQLKLPYAIIPTAPSMNGYLSRNASIAVGGIKQTLPAQLATLVVCDPALIAAAPAPLCAAGVGDALARVTAQCDWLLSHYAIGSMYDALPFELLATSEHSLLTHAHLLPQADHTAHSTLLENLLLSGLGMTLAGGSYPASQGEHLIAHTLEAVGLLTDDCLHGHAIAVTTLSMRLLLQRIFARGTGVLFALGYEQHIVRRWQQAQARIASYFGAKHADALWQSYTKKFPSSEETVAIFQLLEKNWIVLAQEIGSLLEQRPTQRLRQTLLAVGAPTKPEDLGVALPEYQQAVRHACFVRDRFTSLDIAYYLS